MPVKRMLPGPVAILKTNVNQKDGVKLLYCLEPRFPLIDFGAVMRDYSICFIAHQSVRFL